MVSNYMLMNLTGFDISSCYISEVHGCALASSCHTMRDIGYVVEYNWYSLISKIIIYYKSKGFSKLVDLVSKQVLVVTL